jgi:hypothetical protein
MVEIPRIKSTLSAGFDIVILLDSSHDSLRSILVDREFIYVTVLCVKLLRIKKSGLKQLWTTN